MPKRPAAGAVCADCRADDADDLRCACGSLLARYVAGAIELKCRRCKRTMLIALDPPSDPRLEVRADRPPDSDGDPPH